MEKKKVNFDLPGIGDRLKAIRKNLNLKQKELAEILNTTVVTLSDIETGKKRPGIEILFILSEEYRVNPVHLLHGEGDMFRREAETKGVTIEDNLFGEYTDHVREMLWYMQHSMLARSAFLTMVKEYIYKYEKLLEKDIERQKRKDEKEK
jgi:transcriptional regulator with XRE-family HTH domain